MNLAHVGSNPTVQPKIKYKCEIDYTHYLVTIDRDKIISCNKLNPDGKCKDFKKKKDK